MTGTLNQPQRFTATLAPRAGAGPPQTPWASDIDAAGHSLTNAGDISITGHYYRNGVQLAITAQNVVTGARAAETVYQNTTGKTLFLVTCWDLAGKTATLSFLSDAANPPTTEVSQISDSSPQPATQQLFALVLPGNYYLCHIVGGPVNLVSWVEYD